MLEVQGRAVGMGASSFLVVGHLGEVETGVDRVRPSRLAVEALAVALLPLCMYNSIERTDERQSIERGGAQAQFTAVEVSTSGRGGSIMQIVAVRPGHICCFDEMDDTPRMHSGLRIRNTIDASDSRTGTEALYEISFCLKTTTG